MYWGTEVKIAIVLVLLLIVAGAATADNVFAPAKTLEMISIIPGDLDNLGYGAEADFTTNGEPVTETSVRWFPDKEAAVNNLIMWLHHVDGFTWEEIDLAAINVWDPERQFYIRWERKVSVYFPSA